MDREPSLHRRALPPLHPLPTKRQCLKEAALPKVWALQHQARDFATLRAPQRATSAALSSDPFPFFFQVEIQRGNCCQNFISALPLEQFLAAAKRRCFAVQGWQVGPADDLRKASNPAQPAPRKAAKGSAVGFQGAGNVLKNSSWECALVPVSQGGNCRRF